MRLLGMLWHFLGKFLPVLVLPLLRTKVWCANPDRAFFLPNIRPTKPNTLMCLNLPTKAMS